MLIDAGSAVERVFSCAPLVHVAFVSENSPVKVKFRVLEKQAGSMITDPISDMLTRIRNASKVMKPEVAMPYSKMKFALAKVLQNSGYLLAVERTGEENRPELRLELKYENGISAIEHLRRISTPGRRIYAKADELGRVRSGVGISVVSTPNGLMTNIEARKRRLGGEIICEVY